MYRKSDEEVTVAPPVLDSLHRQGYDLDILVNSGSHMNYRPVYRSYYLYTQLLQNSQNIQIGKLVDLTLIRILPWIGKRYVYQEGSWLFSADRENLPRANRAEKFVRDFVGEMRVDNGKPTYKLIHLISPHQPWTTSQDCKTQPASNSITASYNQANCIIKAIAFFLDQLKMQPIYDNSLILVHGDHGNCYPKGLPAPGKGLPVCIGNANPLILIKPPGAQGGIHKNGKFVQLSDLPATISDVLDLAYEGSGVSMFSGKSREEIERNYFLFKPNSVQAFHLDRYTSVTRYSVNGSIFDPASWSEEIIENPYQSIESIPEGKVIRISKNGKSKDGKVLWVRWEGTPVKKYMYIESGGKKTPMSIRKNHFQFPAPKTVGYKPVYIVDPLRNIKQELVFVKN